MSRRLVLAMWEPTGEELLEPSDYDSVTEEQWREYEQAGMLDPIDVRCGQNETDSGDTSTTEASV